MIILVENKAAFKFVFLLDISPYSLFHSNGKLPLLIERVLGLHMFSTGAATCKWASYRIYEAIVSVDFVIYLTCW